MISTDNITLKVKYNLADITAKDQRIDLTSLSLQRNYILSNLITEFDLGTSNVRITSDGSFRTTSAGDNRIYI